MKSYAVPLLKTRRAELSNSTCRVGKDGVSRQKTCYRESFDFRKASAAEDQTPRSATSRVCRV